MGKPLFEAIRQTLILVGSLWLLSGCVTQKLWHSDATTRSISRSGVGVLRLLCPDAACRETELGLYYRIEHRHVASDNPFPPFAQGELLVGSTACTRSIRQDLAILAKAKPLNLTGSTLHAVVQRQTGGNVPPMRFLTIELRIPGPLSPETYAALRRTEARIPFGIVEQSSLDAGGRGIPAGSARIRLGAAACRPSKESAPLPMHFAPSAAPGMLGEKVSFVEGMPTGELYLLFMDETRSKVYCRSAVERVMLTPFSLLADVIVLPVALVTAPLWMPK